MSFRNIFKVHEFGFWAWFIPALDFVFNVGISIVHSLRNIGNEWFDQVVFYESQVLFFRIFFICSSLGVLLAAVADARGEKGHWGLLFAWIVWALFAFVYQYLKTFAVYQ